jgi:Tol biopolymer transport system component
MKSFRKPVMKPISWFHRIPSAGWVAPGFLAVSAAVGLAVVGCGGQKPTHADTRETALTQGDGVRLRPIFSPDGRWIAYTDAGSPDRPGVAVIAASGGEPRRLSREGLAATALGWTTDSRAVLVSLPLEARVQVVDLEGRLLREMRAEPLARFEDLSGDGNRFLWCKLNGDNYDVGLVQVNQDTVWHALEESPAWETDACFGPGPDDVTLVRQASFNAAASELGVFSLATRVWTPLPLPKARITDPAWSPDGKLLAFASDRSGSSDLWVYDAENTRVVQLTSGPEDEVYPEWSPEGIRLVFSRLVVSSHVLVGNPVDMTRSERTHGPARDLYPRASADGRWVAFYRKLPPAGKSPAPADLCVMPTEGGEVTVLDMGGLVPTVGEWMFTWSPDGSHLAYAADDGTGNVDIYRIAREGGRPDRVTIEPGMDAIPAWSPDGRSIAYTRLSGGETQIWTVPATGGLAAGITDHSGINQAPVWAPDSDRLAYVSNTGKGMNEIRLAAASLPGNSHVLLATKDPVVPYAWSAAGDAVLVLRKTSEEWGIDAVDVEGAAPIHVAVGLQGEDRHFARFLPGFERYRDRVYPGRIHVFTDGRKMANLAVIDVARILAGGFQAAGD